MVEAAETVFRRNGQFDAGLFTVTKRMHGTAIAEQLKRQREVVWSRLVTLLLMGRFPVFDMAGV